MSVWTRLFGRSEQQPAASKPRLGLESLEMREVPAIAFVGGWGASSYQNAVPGNSEAVSGRRIDMTVGQLTEIKLDVGSNRDWTGVVAAMDTAADYKHPDLYLNVWLNGSETPRSVPRASESLSVNYLKVEIRPATPSTGKSLWVRDLPGVGATDDGNGARPDAADYSAIAFVGGWGASSATQSGAGSLGIVGHTVSHAARAANAVAIESLKIMVQTDDTPATSSSGDDGGPVIRKGSWLLDVTHSRGGHVADEVVIDGRIITAENFDGAGRSGARSGDGLIMDFIDQDKYVTSAKPLPVLLVLADNRDFYSTAGDTGGLTSEQGANTAPATPTGKLYLGTDVGIYTLDTAENFDSADVGTSGGGGVQTRQTTLIIDM